MNSYLFTNPTQATMPQTILLCTVGGSHQPIVSAVKALQPDYVCFVCTGKDPGTGKPGSEVQITGKDIFIKADFKDDKPTLPNIPAQTGLAGGAFEIKLVPADDLDEIGRVCRQALQDLQQRFPAARWVADYTGGTKTMSAGLVVAALETEGVELQIVTGNRVDLVKVRDGMQTVAEANADRLKLERAMMPYLAGWRHYAYAEAGLGLQNLPRPAERLLASALNRAKDLSLGFAAWDRFDHAKARQTLQAYAGNLPDGWQPYHAALSNLESAQTSKKTAAQLLDLWRNAERRAAQGRYDDAAARLYRMLEWAAQWLLKTHCDVETGDIPEGFAPQGIELTVNREGKCQAGLFAAWSLVEQKTQGAGSAFFNAEKNRLLDHLKIRNQSILAHGFTPISENEWRVFQSWADTAFLPMLLKEAQGVGIKSMPPQLPAVFK